MRDGEDINKNPPMFEIGVVSQISSIGGGLKWTIEVYHIPDGNTRSYSFHFQISEKSIIWEEPGVRTKSWTPAETISS